MNILLLDVAASESGALSVLDQYYKELQSDSENHYYLCVSSSNFKSLGNMTVLKFPWVKKSWLHRVWFELYYVKKLVNKHNISRIFSLENLILADIPCEKWIYLHTSIPFTDLHFSLLSTPKIWVYKHLIGKLIYRSICKADKVIVQTHWMRDACLSKASIEPSRIEVQMPKIDCQDIVQCVDRDKVKHRLFYPATSLKYKNHLLVLNALICLKERGTLGELQFDLTLTGCENTTAKKLYKIAVKNRLPVNFLGKLPREQVMEKYASSTLVFPSYMETFGLPLLEARLSDTLVIASDCSFSREILEGYDGAMFFSPYDAHALADILEQL